MSRKRSIKLRAFNYRVQLLQIVAVVPVQEILHLWVSQLNLIYDNVPSPKSMREKMSAR